MTSMRVVLLAGLLALVGSIDAAGRSAASAPSFGPARSYATGRDPRSVAIGDLNGDRKPELVTANGAASTVSVFLNKGKGRFQVKEDYRAGRDPESVAIGDMTGDGRPDLVTANYQADTVSVFVNNGDGTFGPKRDFGTGYGPGSVSLSDLNGDAKLDLATANAGEDEAGSASVLLNRGDGSFEPKQDYATGGGPESVALGDLNGDGKPDLLTVESLASVVSVLLNRGDGSFGAKRFYGTADEPVSVALGDLNGDRKPDLATANNGDYTVSVLANRGDGRFRAKRSYRTGGEPVSVALGDLNGDGKSDLVTANANAITVAAVSVLLNRGDGSLQAKLHFRSGRRPNSVVTGDLNGDGRVDLATASLAEGTVGVLLNTPGLCNVQDVKGQTVASARRTVARVHCRVGKIIRAYSSGFYAKGCVMSTHPRPGTVLPSGGKVNLVVSLGKRPS